MKTVLTILTILILFPSFAHADDIVVPRDLWIQMAQAIAAQSMPLTTHQQVQQILQNVSRESDKKSANDR